MAGYIYFFRHTNTKPVKIGMTESESVQKRFDCFRVASPYGAEIVGSIKCDNPRELERELHFKFRSKRLNGEFFDITDQDVMREVNGRSFREEKFIYLFNRLDTYFSDDLTADVDKQKLISHIYSFFDKKKTETPDFIKKISLEYKPNRENDEEKVELTNSEIMQLDLIKEFDITPRKLGMGLKNSGYTNQVKHKDGRVKRVYTLYKKL